MQKMPKEEHALKVKQLTAKLLQDFANRTRQQVYLKFEDVDGKTKIQAKWINRKGERELTTDIDLRSYTKEKPRDLAKELSQNIELAILNDNK